MSELDIDILTDCMIEQDNGVLIHIEVKTGAKKIGIEGVDKWRRCMEVKVKARAEKGKANKELIQFLSSLLSLPSSDFIIVRGEKSRLKSIKVTGVSKEDLMQRLMKEIDKM